MDIDPHLAALEIACIQRDMSFIREEMKYFSDETNLELALQFLTRMGDVTLVRQFLERFTRNQVKLGLGLRSLGTAGRANLIPVYSQYVTDVRDWRYAIEPACGNGHLKVVQEILSVAPQALGHVDMDKCVRFAANWKDPAMLEYLLGQEKLDVRSVKMWVEIGTVACARGNQTVFDIVLRHLEDRVTSNHWRMFLRCTVLSTDEVFRKRMFNQHLAKCGDPPTEWWERLFVNACRHPTSSVARWVMSFQKLPATLPVERALIAAAAKGGISTIDALVEWGAKNLSEAFLATLQPDADEHKSRRILELGGPAVVSLKAARIICSYGMADLCDVLIRLPCNELRQLLNTCAEHGRPWLFRLFRNELSRRSQQAPLFTENDMVGFLSRAICTDATKYSRKLLCDLATSLPDDVRCRILTIALDKSENPHPRAARFLRRMIEVHRKPDSPS